MQVNEQNGPLLIALFGAVRKANMQDAFSNAIFELHEAKGNVDDPDEYDESIRLLEGVREAAMTIVDHEMNYNSTKDILAGAPIHKGAGDA